METTIVLNKEIVGNDNQHMTSLEIAELTGKQHKNLMRDIRNMEPAWERIAGLKFELSTYKDSTGRLLPCYSLTKTECLYIATKFNDEARAKLVLRWEQLEKCTRGQSPCALPEPKKILALADEIIGEGLRMLNEPAEDTLTATQVPRTSLAYSSPRRRATCTIWMMRFSMLQCCSSQDAEITQKEPHSMVNSKHNLRFNYLFNTCLPMRLL